MVITLDDFQNIVGENEEEVQSENEDEFHQKFINELKRKEYLEKLKAESN